MTRRTREIFDHSTGTLYIEHVEDVEPVIEEVTEFRNNVDNGFSDGRQWRKIGSIPLVVVEHVLRTRGINLMEDSPEARKEVKKILNEFSKFRTVDKPV